MATNYIFSLTPTFTQGLVLGQLTILVLLYLILKYLFLDSTEYPFETSSYHPRLDSDVSLRQRKQSLESVTDFHPDDAESAVWFNVLMKQIVEVYRSKLRGDVAGAEGDEIARKRIEDFANKIRPAGFLDHIKVHSIDLGVTAPRVLNARLKNKGDDATIQDIEVDMSYTDTISLSLSTSYLFNYPMSSFARLPVSLTISLSIFKASLTMTPPSPTDTSPVLDLRLSPDFTLNLSTSSLMGSRAKLANVPKLHELIQHQVRKVLAQRASWKVVLPGLSTVEKVKQELKEELKLESE